MYIYQVITPRLFLDGRVSLLEGVAPLETPRSQGLLLALSDVVSGDIGRFLALSLPSARRLYDLIIAGGWSRSDNQPIPAHLVPSRLLSLAPRYLVDMLQVLEDALLLGQLGHLLLALFLDPLALVLLDQIPLLLLGHYLLAVAFEYLRVKSVVRVVIRFSCQLVHLVLVVGG